MYLMMDMGTSNTRLWLCEGESVVGLKKGAFGAGSTKSNGREYLVDSLKKLMGELLAEHDVNESQIERVIVSGMAGSNIGLYDLPHISIPANADTLFENLKEVSLPEVSDVPFLFVPGLKKMDGGAIADVMRGEETETAGIVATLPQCADAVLVLPGTHNKVIATDEKGRVTDFFTSFSGELINIIMKNSILAGQVAHGLEIVDSEVLAGDRYAKEMGLTAAVFHVRVMGMNGKSQAEMSSFLYGAVMGQEIDAINRLARGRRIFVGGRESLRHIYRLLLGENAASLDESVAENAVRNGLMALYGRYGRK